MVLIDTLQNSRSSVSHLAPNLGRCFLSQRQTDTKVQWTSIRRVAHPIVMERCQVRNGTENELNSLVDAPSEFKSICLLDFPFSFSMHRCSQCTLLNSSECNCKSLQTVIPSYDLQVPLSCLQSVLLFQEPREECKHFRETVLHSRAGVDDQVAKKLPQAFCTKKTDSIAINLSAYRFIHESDFGHLWEKHNRGWGAALLRLNPCDHLGLVRVAHRGTLKSPDSIQLRKP